MVYGASSLHTYMFPPPSYRTDIDQLEPAQWGPRLRGEDAGALTIWAEAEGTGRLSPGRRRLRGSLQPTRTFSQALRPGRWQEKETPRATVERRDPAMPLQPAAGLAAAPAERTSRTPAQPQACCWPIRVSGRCDLASNAQPQACYWPIT